jgi:hypothetical protein
MKINLKAIIVIGVVIILYLTINNITKSFDDNANSAYHEIEYYFINRTHGSEMDSKYIGWINDQGYEIESKPESFTDREKYIIDNLSSMAVRVAMMNGIPYRDRTLEDEYYDARDSVMQALFEGE